jgi:2-keto-3-deoxy-L-rhamnonate aldolase RhmA
MRVNAFRHQLEDSKLSVGTFLNFPDPSLVEFTGLAGFDWLIIDAEHEGASVADCYTLVRAADAVGLATIVRVPRVNPDIILSYAETGVSAVMGPHINSVQAARALVAALSYPPFGERGVSVGSRAANYGLTQSPSVYLDATHEHAIPIALIEDDIEDAELKAVIDVGGLDVFTIGPGDLAAAMGLPGQAQDPRVQERIRHIASHVVAAGKKLMLLALTPKDAELAIELGARLLVTGNASLLRSAMTQYLADVRSIEVRAGTDPATTQPPSPGART